MITLSEIRTPVAAELNDFEHYFKDIMKTEVPLLNILLRYILKRKGKQMRPLLVFLTGKLLGKPNQSTYTAAALIEILHTATLIHDDVVDDAHERRGFFSVNAIWKSKVSVLLGDYLLAKGLLLAMNNKEYDLLQIVSNAVREMSEGELLQIKYSRKLNIEEAEYFEIIKKKTATLIGCCSAGGAKSVGMGDDMVSKMKNFGEFLGIAFQIKDDLFDFQDNHSTGKPSWNDLREKKLTLPLIYSLSKAERSDKRHIIHLLNNKSTNSNKYIEIVDFVKKKGGADYARHMMNEYSNLALNELEHFPASDAKHSLVQFVHFTTTRTS